MIMAKSVINLVKELGVKSTAEVLQLLRQVGVDTAATGFGVMSKVDDDVVAKLHAMQGGDAAGPAAEAGAPVRARVRGRSRGAQLEEPSRLDLLAPAVRKAASKDFFGAKRAVAVAPAEASVATAPPPRVAMKPSERKRISAPAAAAAPPAQTREAPASQVRSRVQAPAAGARPDLSGGPKILSMPDPDEAMRLRQRREAPAPAPARQEQPAATPEKRGVGGRVLKDRRKGAGELGGGRRLRESGEFEEEQRLRSRKRVFRVAGKHGEAAPTVVPHLKVAGSMTLREVAGASGVKVAEIVRYLMNELSVMATINYAASVEEISLVAEHFGIDYIVALEKEPEGELVHFEVVDSTRLLPRPPVVTIMGHVDHGKTKLLDIIRKANVVADEAGGITQHIGAYQVERKGKHITFIDTPGHEAFTAMRARGSQVTDIVVLVVAADDGVMPQTIEAINHARAANVPLVVAVNKIDKPDANPDRVKTQLGERGLVPEEWGGDTVFVNISALKGTNIDDLLEMILLTAELVDPKADAAAPPFGVVIESKVDVGIGVVATVLVQQGTFRKGHFILSGVNVGRVKRMENERGEELASATPAVPVRILGFSDPPENGEKVYAFANKKQAQAIADQRQDEARVKAVAGSTGRMSLEKFFSVAEASDTKELNLIVKADVGGSEEALCEALKKLEVEGMHCNVVSSGVGQVNETDVNLAAASGAVVIGFTVGVSSTARRLAEREHVDIRLYDVIYKVTEDIELAMKGLLAPEFEERELGRAEVRAIFKSDRNGTVAGGYVLDGLIKRGAKFRLKRAGKLLGEVGTLSSLKRFKDDVREVASGFECGLLIDLPGADPEEGDVLEFYEVVEKVRV